MVWYLMLNFLVGELVVMSNCESCGQCCKMWTTLSASKEDFEKWKDTYIEDYIVCGKLWFDPETKEKLDICPFLIDNKCSIYPKDNEIDLRPNICIRYPMNKPCLNLITNKPMDCGNGNDIEISFFRRK